MKKYILFFLVILFSSCTGKKRFASEQDFANKIEKKAAGNYKEIVVIPRTGCGGCISYSEHFLKNNYHNKKILFVILDVVSERLLQERLGNVLENRNVIVLKEDEKEIYQKLINQYPRVIYLDNRKVVKVEEQSPENNAIGHLETFLSRAREKDLQIIRLDKCLRAPDHVGLLRKILVPEKIIQPDKAEQLSHARSLSVDSSKIGLVANGRIYVYTSKGKFVSKIGRIGKGPKEYFSVVDYTLIYDTCYILANYGKKLIAYTTGNDFLFSSDLSGGSLTINHSGNNKYIFLFNNVNLKSDWNEPKLIDVFSTDKRSIVKSIGIITSNKEDHNNMFIAPASYVYDGSVFYKDYFNDTIKEITDDLRCIPYKIISLGKYNPPRILLEKIEYRKKLDKYFANVAFWETNNYFFIYFDYKNQKVYTVFDKENEKFLFCIRIGYDEVESNISKRQLMAWIESVWPSFIFNNKSYSLTEPMLISEKMRKEYQIQPDGNPCIVISKIIAAGE